MSPLWNKEVRTGEGKQIAALLTITRHHRLVLHSQGWSICWPGDEVTERAQQQVITDWIFLVSCPTSSSGRHSSLLAHLFEARKGQPQTLLQPPISVKRLN